MQETSKIKKSHKAKKYLRNLWITRKLFGTKGEDKDYVMIALFWWNLISILLLIILVAIYSSASMQHPEWNHQKILPKPYGTIIGTAFLFLMSFIVGMIFVFIMKYQRYKKNKKDK